MNPNKLMATAFSAAALAGCGENPQAEAPVTAPPEAAQTYNQTEQGPHQPQSYQELAALLNYEAGKNVFPSQQLEVNTAESRTKLYNLSSAPEDRVEEGEVTDLIHFFESFAKRGTRIKLDVKLIGGEKSNVVYRVGPKPEKNRYIIVVPKGITIYDIPQSPYDESQEKGFTITYPNQDAMVVFVQAPEKQTLYTEICQSTLRVEAEPIEIAHDSINRLGQEGVCNSFGKALELANNGLTFSEYRKKMDQEISQFHNVYTVKGRGIAGTVLLSKDRYEEFQSIQK